MCPPGIIEYFFDILRQDELRFDDAVRETGSKPVERIEHDLLELLALFFPGAVPKRVGSVTTVEMDHMLAFQRHRGVEGCWHAY
ncbi:hypothetical protein X734_32420 [Mesorhizobium sp. L2C084A000]|nr:hypothetical protein X734_32420 [Mesorhizobium sp. L2C084A000]